MSDLLINNLLQHVQGCQGPIVEAILRVVNRGWFVMGPELQGFEGAFAKYVGVGHCLGVANGTDALELSLRAVGVSAGDRVATVANAGAYTTTALAAIGAMPLYLDVDRGSHLVTEAEVDRALALGVKAVVITHLYGRAVSATEAIVSKCAAKGAAVVEDCAQAHGAKVDGRMVGSFGDAGCFSFYPTKNLGALGDGGAVVTKHDMIAQRLGRLRQYGWTEKYVVELEGARNSRLDELQAAVLHAMLPQLDSWNDARRAVARQYCEGIQHPQVSLPAASGADYVAHLFVVRSPQRASLQQHLKEQGIRAEVHYPVPDYRQPVFAKKFGASSLTNTDLLAAEILTLPCYPEMGAAEVKRVIAAVNSWTPAASLKEGACQPTADLAA